MNQIEYFILPRRYKRTWALPRFCLLIAPWKRSHLTGMGMEVICTVQNGVCFEIRKKVGEEVFVHVSRRLLLSPVFAPIDTEILSWTVGPDKIDCPPRRSPFSPVPSRFLAPKDPSSSSPACLLCVPPSPASRPLFWPARLLRRRVLSPHPSSFRRSAGPRPLAGNVRRGKSMESAPPVLGATPPGHSPSGCCIRLLVD
jgi:hypothetical protein